MTSVASKRDIRAAIRAEREALSAGEVTRLSRLIFARAIELVERLNAAKPLSSFGFYYPIRGEVDTRALFQHIRKQKLRCAFPRVDVGTTTITFHEVADLAYLQTGTYGIAEPVGGEPVNPDLIFVPGVAFSHDGFRLGYGGGYYDRAVSAWAAAGGATGASLTAPLRPARPILVGLAYDFQVLSELPSESHDQAVDFVVSESQVLERHVPLK